jgi:hypothetical protein
MNVNSSQRIVSAAPSSMLSSQYNQIEPELRILIKDESGAQLLTENPSQKDMLLPFNRVITNYSFESQVPGGCASPYESAPSQAELSRRGKG